MLNINGNLVQLTSAPQQAATVTQPAVTSPAPAVVPQATATLATTAPNQLAMTNGNIVMVRNAPDVRNTINTYFVLKY